MVRAFGSARAAGGILALALGLWGCLNYAAAADQTEALLNQALDKQVTFNFNDVLPQTINKITETTGVRIEISPDVYDLLPWGRETNIKANIQNQTLREALTGITRNLGSTFRLSDQAVVLEPMPALQRLARRSTIDELKALNLLASTPLAADATQFTLKDLLKAVDERLLAIHSGYSLDNHSTESVAQSVPVTLARNVTLMDALEDMTRQSGATWYPWGKNILILSKPDQINHQLSKTISVRYDGVPLEQVLLDLRQRSGIKFDFAPGALQQIPVESRTIRMFLDNVSIESALDSIKGLTGLEYTIREDGIYLSAKAGATTARDRIFVNIPLPGGMQMLVPESQMPPDVRQWLAHKREEAAQKLVEQMKAEGFKPIVATQPTTRPTGNEPL